MRSLEESAQPTSAAADRHSTMAKPDLETLKAQLEEQDRALAEMGEALQAFDRIDVPPSFFAELDDVCTVARAAPAMPPELHFAMRA